MATATASDYSTTTVANGLYYPLSGNPSAFLVAADITGKANLAGATFTGLVTTVAASAATAGLNVPHTATVPTSPVNGDIWTTTTGVFARINAGTTQLMNLGSTQTVSGSITFSNASQTLGSSTGTGTINVASGATISAATKTVNIGTGGVVGSTTTTTVGPVLGASTTTIGATTAASTLNLATGATLTATTKAVNIGTAGVSGSTTNIAIGGTAGTSTTTLNGTTNGVTQSPGNNTTALATTAFVTAAVPAFATNTQAKTGTSTTLAVNPASMRSNDLNPRAWQLPRASFGTAVVGTGATAQVGGMVCYLDAGSVSLNSALCRVQSNNDATFHLYGTSTNGNASFSDKLFMSGRCGTYTVDDAAKTVMISVGKTLLSGAGSLATKGVGLKHVGGTSTPLLLTVHNGTTLTDVSSSYTPVNLGAFDWEIYSDGAGNVTLTVNGTQVASTALGPTGACATAQITYQEEIFFTATPALSYNNRLISARGKLIFGT